MKIIYLTWGETPRSYGVFGSQVLGQLIETKKQFPNDQFLFVSAVPVIHSGLLREKLAYYKELSKVKNLLGDIGFKWLVIFSSQNFIYTSRWFFKWIFFGALWQLKKVVEKFEPDIIHCRSYLAAWAAGHIREKYGFKFKIIFDARGLYPEELALKKTYLDSSPNYQFLKNIEKKLLRDCDVTIAVSDTMAEHFVALNARRVETIYLSASFDKLSVLNKKRSNFSRPINFCYVGSLSIGTWHRPSSLFHLFLRLKELFPDSTLTIVTKSDHEALRKIFASFLSGDVRIGSSNSLDELKIFLSEADFGLMSYFEPVAPREKILANMVMAVKTAEYLCAGIPMIVNQYCGGASQMVQTYNLGLVYDPHNLDQFTAKEIENFISSHPGREKISEQAKQLFDYRSNAQKYTSLYQEMIMKDHH